MGKRKRIRKTGPLRWVVVVESQQKVDDFRDVQGGVKNRDGTSFTKTLTSKRGGGSQGGGEKEKEKKTATEGTTILLFKGKVGKVGKGLIGKNHGKGGLVREPANIPLCYGTPREKL